MNKRLISLFLCLVMLLALCLTGCGEKSDDDIQNEINQEASKDNVTLSMWVVSKDKVSKDIAKDVVDALNQMTEAKYKARLSVQFLTEDEYYSKLSSAITAYNPSAGNAASKPNESETGDENNDVAVDSDGLYHEIYPTLKPNQVDIIYIGDLYDAEGKLLTSGKEMYQTFISKGWLASLDTYINSTSKAIKEYISPTLLSAVKHANATYAIPNNNMIGEYTYMLLNQELMDRYYMSGHLTQGSIDSFYNPYVFQYLQMVNTNEEDVLLIDASYETCLEQLAYYWSVNAENQTITGNQFSVFGSLYQDLTLLSRGEVALGVQSLFENEEFVSSFLTLNRYRFDGQLRSEENIETVYGASALKFVKGDLSILTREDGQTYYDEVTDAGTVRYYVVPVQYPTATDEDVYGSMFGVCAKSREPGRAMDIITYLNSNVEFRNLLQYGVLGKHYTIDSQTQAVTRLSNKNGEQYVMDIEKTGNMFLAYFENGMNVNQWEFGKEQNINSLIHPMYGFDFQAIENTNEQKEVLKTDLAYMEQLNAQIVSLLDACENYADMETMVTSLRALLNTKAVATVDDISASQALVDSVTDTESGVVKGDFALLLYRLQRLTSVAKMAELPPVTDAEEGETAGQTVPTYYSPYGIYHQWMVKFKYLPK